LPHEAVPDQRLVADLPLLRFLSDEVRSQVVARFVPVTYPFGGVLATQGEPADALYVLVSGRARVIKRLDHDEEAPLNVLHPGDSFGETELFNGRPHPTTVRAMSDVLALRLDKTAFNELLEADRDVGTYLELQLKHGTLRGFFRDFPAFANIPSEAMVGIVLAELEPRTVAAGEVIFSQGDAAGPLFLIEDGRARIMRRDSDGLQFVGAVGAGQYVGEESALTGEPRTTTVEAITACRLLALGPDTVSRLAAALPEFRQRLE
jgi:CRP-like cAMP-binding protein